MSLAMTTKAVLCCFIFFWVWTHTLSYQFPVPLSMYLSSPIGFITLILTTWFNFPLVWRKARKFRRRMMYFAILMIYPTMVFKYQLDTIFKELMKNQSEYQIIMSLLLPCVRELNLWIITKLTEKTANGDLPGANIVARFSLSAWYTIALCLILGSLATNTITWVLVGTDFAMNTILCMRIVWKRKQSPDNVGQHIDLIHELAVYELVEFLAPGAFILSFAILVHGPNCDLVGNLCNDYWQFELIQDFSQAYQNMGTFFVVDLLSTMVTVVTLKTCCQIDILHIMMQLLQEFSYVFCAILGTRIWTVSKIHNI